MQSVVASYSVISDLIVLLEPDATHLARRRELLRNGRVVLNINGVNVEYRLTKTHRLAANAGA